MPYSKRQFSTNRRRSTERQIVLARRSRSIKASLLKVLSLDLVTLYQADQSKNSENMMPRNPTQPMPRQPMDFQKPLALHESDRSIPSNLGASVRPDVQLSEPELRQIQNTSDLGDKGVPRPASQSSLVIVVVRCFAFLLGVLIRSALIFYAQPFAILLSGVAIAAIGIGVLMVVVFTPWKKKLLWNLACLFGGLLIAVLIL